MQQHIHNKTYFTIPAKQYIHNTAYTTIDTQQYIQNNAFITKPPEPYKHKNMCTTNPYRTIPKQWCIHQHTYDLNNTYITIHTSQYLQNNTNKNNAFITKLPQRYTYKINTH